MYLFIADRCSSRKNPTNTMVVHVLAKLTSNEVFITDTRVFARLPAFSPYSSHPFFSPLCISRETVKAENRLLANIVGTPDNTTVVHHLAKDTFEHVQSTPCSPACLSHKWAWYSALLQRDCGLPVFNLRGVNV